MMTEVPERPLRFGYEVPFFDRLKIPNDFFACCFDVFLVKDNDSDADLILNLRQGSLVFRLSLRILGLCLLGESLRGLSSR